MEKEKRLRLRELPLTARRAALRAYVARDLVGVGATAEADVIDDGFCGLEDEVADALVENCVGTVGVPVGVALNLVVDGEPVCVPMAVEEPSVIAAVSAAAKTLCAGSSSETIHTHRACAANIASAQILLQRSASANKVAHEEEEGLLQSVLAKCYLDLESAGNARCPGINRRGGGVAHIHLGKVINNTSSSLCDDDHDPATMKEFLEMTGQQGLLPSFWFVLHVDVNVCEAMGANTVTSVAEAIGKSFCENTGSLYTPAVSIVTNMVTKRTHTAWFEIEVDELTYKGVPGAVMSARIVNASRWADSDHYRKVTHNKGVMNGIDAVAVACGQDWRAIEAACHSYSKDRCLTSYTIIKKNNAFYLKGEIKVPLCVGTKGGVLSSKAKQYAYAMQVMKNPDAKRLAGIMCAIGLCQNFAALRALVTEGILQGHMKLHNRHLN